MTLLGVTLLGLRGGLVHGLGVSESPEVIRSREARRERMYGTRIHTSAEQALASDCARVVDALAKKFG